MTEPVIRFEDGAAYERFMGVWSQSAGAAFLDWLAPAPGQRWLDVGCGNGAFSEMIARRLAPSALDGIDPSPAQIAFARSRPGTPGARYREGDAMALPYADQSFDCATMALVLFFVPVPATGVAEMQRVTRPGGSVSAYVWNFPEGGFPYAVLQDALTAQGKPTLQPPQAAISTPEALHALWTEAGLREVESTTITVHRTYASFEEFWNIALMGPLLATALADMNAEEVRAMQDYARQKLHTEADGKIVCKGWASAVKGVVG